MSLLKLSYWPPHLSGLPLVVITLFCLSCRSAPELVEPAETTTPSLTVSKGSEEKAESYYRDMEKALGLSEGELKDADALLKFCGYATGKKDSIKDLYDTPIFDDPEILSTRYFAPKITDVSELDPQKVSTGWRKIIRLHVRPSSKAAVKHVKDLYILFNQFISYNDLKKGGDPYKQDATNNQAMLVMDADEPGARVFWMVFGDPTKDGGVRLNALNATFDARDPKLDPAKLGDNYYVPEACNQCHGQDERKLKVNFVDTDHLYDRVQAGDDFHQVFTSHAAVLFDGGKIKADGGDQETSPAYEQAFTRLLTLNKEIQKQNQVVDPKGFALRAVANWVKRHEKSPAYLPPLSRPIPRDGERTWDAGNPTDSALLPVLNRYCFRCHSSVKFNVFDKTEVHSRAGRMIKRLQIEDRSKIMPQDRNLSDDQIKQLTTLLEELQKQQK